MIKRLSEYDDPGYHRPNDAWIEVPILAVSEDGEHKTVMVRRRSLRSKRRVFTLSCTAFTIGLIMILLASPVRNEWIAPGALSSNHAQILAGEGANRCSACHDAANESVASWIASAFLGNDPKQVTQSDLCLNCHEQSLQPATALNPHNVLPKTLAKVSAKYVANANDAGKIIRPPVAGHNIACNACHREHHGAGAELSALTDQQCQTCHQKTIHGFEIDHPEFSNYPLKRRSRIAFDHSTHSQQHFPSRQSEFNCSQCHIDDDFQNVKKLANYEQSCAACHDQQVLESGQEGLALISLPMLDTDAIEAAQLDIGNWPLAATGDFDGPLPPIMRVLLSADPQAARVLNSFGPEFDFADIDPENEAHVRHAVELVWAVKRLLYDLAVNGPHEVRSRLQTVMQLEISDDELNQMISNLDQQVFQNAIRRWIPRLAEEMSNPPTVPSAVVPKPTVLRVNEVKQAGGSWWPTNEALLMRGKTGYPIPEKQPRRPANPVSIQSAKLGPGSTTIVRISTESPRPPKQEPETLDDTPPFNVRLKNVHANPLNDPELLAVNPLTLLESGTPATVAQNRPDVVTQSPSLPEMEAPNDLDGPTPVNRTPQPQPTDPIRQPEFAQVDLPAVVVPSGWFRDDTLFRISYRPRGHADPCIQSWIELVTRGADADSRPETRQLFEKTISMTAIGLCRTCHTADQLPDRSFQVNWRAQYRDPSVRSFTRFLHGPHMIQRELRDCSACHELDPDASNHASFEGVDATVAVSNFVAMKKSDCASCHAAGQTNHDCTQCHNYHIGSKVIGTR